MGNLFLPDVSKCSVLEYSPIAEILGMNPIANIAMNCSAPDTGNMEVIEKFGNEEQKKQWLEPLLEGTIRSAFAMTEPGVASSDATNISTRIRRDGDEYVINGQKWYISGACRPECKVFVLLGRMEGNSSSLHNQHSMILVPRDSPGVTIVRPLGVFGHVHDHAEILFNDVRVPVTNLLLGEGRGFEIAQGRLGPGRIHHCMRLIGCAQRALDMACERVEQRVAFGKPLSKQQSIRENIAQMHCDIEQARLLTLKAADKMDRYGNKISRDLIAAIKIVAPTMACNVIDESIQMHGAAGTSQDFVLSAMYAYARTIKLADGPDQVHMMQLGRNLIADKNA